MNQNNQNQGNKKSYSMPVTENMVEDVDFDEDDYGSDEEDYDTYEDDYGSYEDDLPPYPAGEAYQVGGHKLNLTQSLSYQNLSFPR